MIKGAASNTSHSVYFFVVVPYFFQNSVVINFLTEVVSDTTCGFLKHLGLLGPRSYVLWTLGIFLFDC